MLKARRQGEVLTQFVVDARGIPDTATFQAVKSSDQEFTEAVRRALPSMRFTPAVIGGKAVPQLVQQPFTFALGSTR
jgi:protein TonB